MFWLALPVLAVMAIANRLRAGRAIERDYAARFPSDADGIVRGARAFTLNGTTGRAVLLLHGSGDTPQSVRYLAEQLNKAGYTVYAPLLPGHGRSPRAFAAVSAAEYLHAAKEAFEALRRMHSWVAVAGQSMGGAIGARLADTQNDVSALVLLAPYLMPPTDVRAAAAAAWLWRPFTAYITGGPAESVRDRSASAHNMAYGSYTPAALSALVETARLGHEALLRIRVPTLVVNSANDNRIPRPLAERALAGTGALVETRWVEGCAHIITVDYCKDEVARLVLAFLDREVSS